MMQGNEKYQRLVQKLEHSYGFDGFYHCTDFSNFIKIMQSKYLYCRKEMCGKEFKDAAMKGVIRHGGSYIQGFSRLYWRAKTPTNYKNEGIKLNSSEYHMPLPVYLVFSSEILYHNEVEFTNKNASTNDCLITADISLIELFNWDKIFYNTDRGVPYYTTKQYMCAELLYPKRLSTEYLSKVIFRCNADYKNAIKILGKLQLFTVDSSKFYNHISTDEGPVNYLKDYTIEYTTYGFKLNLEFSNSYSLDMFRHTLVIASPKDTKGYGLEVSNSSSAYSMSFTNSEYMKNESEIIYFMNDVVCMYTNL